MTAAVDLRCCICGARWPLETAVMAHGPEYVCEDGYACASRANTQRAGKTRLTAVTEVSAGENESGASMPRPSGETP